ncbi:MAG: GNAT family N-acetyltransferase [Clostridiales Family XIII bacterium]|jgi:ribosomal protein S18 acetylase RimI-like enzyme|nr:GNAT family N-acetyltransferase [Clostridiales Family XIII bacterium]
MPNIRPIRENEYEALEDFLYHAIFVPQGHEVLSRDTIFIPEIFVYIDNFGKPDDVCFVAEEDGDLIGAAWSRILSLAGKKGYGNIDEKTPELAVSVLPEYRGNGIGTRLIGSLIRALRENGYSRLSLSVQKENPATRLYLRLGFQIASENTEDYIMVLDFTRSVSLRACGNIRSKL